jgi:Trk K+ transport system NAD-binding subunit
LVTNGRSVVLIDSNERSIKKAKDLGLTAINANIYSDNLMDDIELNNMGYLMALTINSDINKYAINKFRKQFGENGAFRLISKEEMNDEEKCPKEGLFSKKDHFTMLSDVAKDHPSIQEIDLESREHYESLIEITNNDKDIIPLFIKDNDGELHIISSNNLNVDTIEKGFQLVYLGKPIDVEKV